MGQENWKSCGRRERNDVRSYISAFEQTALGEMMPLLTSLLTSVQSHLQHYAEPTANPESIPTSGANVLSSTLLPLSQGVFTHNASGVPIIVVCTKADRIDDDLAAAGMGGGLGGVVKSKGADWEERTDGIMQVLRTICLKCERD